MVNVTLFSQIIHHLDRNLFARAVKQYQTDKHSKGINSWTHLITMLFCHLAKAQSIREITNGLRSISGNLNHLGIQGKTPSRSSLSYINEHRDWMMFREYYFLLKEKLNREGYLRRKKFKRIDRKIYLLDSTIISVCISIFDWARYRQEKGAIKLHTLLDYDGCLPSYLFMTEGKHSDVKHARYMHLPARSVVVADRGYQDFKMLYRWKKESITFVIRLKKSIKHEMIKELYKQRWMIEIFFKELKQHLKIKSFIGMNENAMLIQIWTALIVLLLLRYLQTIAQYPWHLSNLIAFLRMNLFVKILLTEWLNNPFKPPEDLSIDQRQEKLF